MVICLSDKNFNTLIHYFITLTSKAALGSGAPRSIVFFSADKSEELAVDVGTGLPPMSLKKTFRSSRSTR